HLCRHLPGSANSQCERDFSPFLHTLSVWVLIAASLTFTPRTNGYSLLGTCMGACLRLNTPLRITCRPGRPSSGWIVTLTRRSGDLGFFSRSPSPRSSLPLYGAALSWVITNSARLPSWLTMYPSCCCHGSHRAGY